jgi:hypothetical protein
MALSECVFMSNSKKTFVSVKARECGLKSTKKRKRIPTMLLSLVKSEGKSPINHNSEV